MSAAVTICLGGGVERTLRLDQITGVTTFGRGGKVELTLTTGETLTARPRGEKGKAAIADLIAALRSPEAWRKLTVGVSLSRKVNLGNYESAEAFVSVQNVTAATTEEEIDALLAGGGSLAYRKASVALKGNIQAAIEEAAIVSSVGGIGK